MAVKHLILGIVTAISLPLMADTTLGELGGDTIARKLISDVDTWNGGISGIEGSIGMGVYARNRGENVVDPQWDGAFRVNVNEQFVPFDPTGYRWPKFDSLTSISQSRAIYMNVEAYRASVHLQEDGERFLTAAVKGADFLIEGFLDTMNRGGPVDNHSGFVWELNNDVALSIRADSKSPYGQVHPVFALAHTYGISGDVRFLNAALDTWATYRFHFDDSQEGRFPGAYLPQQSVDYSNQERDRDSDYMTHALEAALVLWDVLPEGTQKEELGNEIVAICQHFVEDMIRMDKGNSNLLYIPLKFDENWEGSENTHVSVRHQFEQAYLLGRTVERGLGDSAWIEAGRGLMAYGFAYGVESLPGEIMGITNNNILPDGAAKDSRNLGWWEQAEFARALAHFSVVHGDGYQQEFNQVMRLIDNHLEDAVHGGWWQELDIATLEPVRFRDKGFIWKVNYHNVMLKSELIRLDGLDP